MTGPETGISLLTALSVCPQVTVLALAPQEFHQDGNGPENVGIYNLSRGVNRFCLSKPGEPGRQEGGPGGQRPWVLSPSELLTRWLASGLSSSDSLSSIKIEFTQHEVHLRGRLVVEHQPVCS